MSLDDELQDLAEPADLSGTAGAAAVGSAAGELSADEAAPAKRFKKSAPEPAAVEPAAVEPAAVAPAASSLSTTASADASGWDFEKDLENIFTTQARDGEKPRGKAKSKAAQ
jgi:hypothetical protein